MAMASWMIRGRNSRSGRTYRNRHDSEDDVQLDLTKDCAENAKQLLLNICKKQGLTDGKKFGYLNAFVKLLSKTKETGELGYTVEQLLQCLQVVLAHDASQVRAAALRAVRYLLKEENHVKTLHDLRYPYLIARSFDLHLHNDAERMQALRLIRRMLVLAPTVLSPSLVHSLVALANGAAEEKDKMLRVCLATLSEICVLNTEIFIKCGGVTAVQHNLLECSMPRIAESLCGILLFLLNNPFTRERAGVRLQALAAPFCDLHWDPSRNRDEREVRFQCSRLALLSVLRSWPGVLHFCNPGDSSGLRAIVNILYVRQLEVRKAVLDLLYELLGLPQPEWTDEFSVALEAVNPSHPRDSWRLSEGFVAAEGRSILPHLAKCRPNLVEMHLALLLYTFLEVGLLEAIAEVIVTADTFISVRATILLGELLHRVHLLLPPECCNLTPPLPTLVAKAANPDDPASQNQALAAIAALARLQTMLKKQPAPASVFLDQLLQKGVWGIRCRSGGLPPVSIAEELGLSFGANVKSKREKNKLYQFMLKNSDDILRDSMVLSNKDGFSWNWNVVRAILKSRSEPLRRLEDSSYKTFVRRLIQYYKPSSNRFSRMELSTKRPINIYTLTGFELLDCLLDAEESEGQKLLAEFLADLWLQVDAITSSRSAHDCLFSPQHVSNSLCQDYFLFIGRLCRTPHGLRVLEAAGILQQLMNLVVATNHECYVKLIVAGLDYSLDAMPRVILGKVLSAGVEVSRLYATQHMLVLLRAQLSDFHKWGIELLVMQLYDSSHSVSSAALNVLSEAVENKACLESLISLRPSLLHLGDKGLLLLISFLSTPTGFSFLQDAGFVATQLERWATSFNCRYVRLVEGELHDSLTLHQRGEDGRYSQRVTSARHYVKDVLVPPHLYGQLVQHNAGLTALKQDPYLPELFQVIRDGLFEKDSDVLQLKAALWAVGHICTSEAGVTLLEQAEILRYIVQLAEGCAEYAAKATAFYALGLVATTSKGADLLSKFGWLSVRHDRHELWPIIEGNPNPEQPASKTEVDIDDSVLLSSEMETTQAIELWDLEPGEGGSEGRLFYLPGDEESGNEDEGMLLHESSFTAQFTPDTTERYGVDIAQGRQLSQSRGKSATLPHWRPGVPTSRHMRSLSESKQLPPQIIVGGDTQVVGDWTPQISRVRNSDSSFSRGSASDGNTLVPKPEETKSRSNSCTDSSGVSSCDSGAGRQAPSERLPPTLSPIPSSASLHTLQSTTMMRRASQFSQRKLSASTTHGSVTSEGTHSSPSDTIVGASSLSRLSQQDLLGYATLRSLHRHRRPLLNDSNSGRGETVLAFDDSFPLSMSITGIGACSPATSVRGLKTHSLDRHFSHPAFGELEGRVNPLMQEGNNSLPLEVGRKNRNDSGHPCYLGVCLPRNLVVLYQSSNLSRPAIPSQQQGSTSFSELEQLPEVGQEIEPSSSSESEDIDNAIPSHELLSTRRQYSLHAASMCMKCSRFVLSGKISVNSSQRHRNDTENSQRGLESPVLWPLRQYKSQSISNGGADTLAWNTPTGSITSSNSPSLSGQKGDNAQHSQKLAHREILKHVSRMSNPVWAKLSKQALIHLKQKDPTTFQDVCLYSAVSQQLASCSYRYVARRFIQELFLGLNVDVLYEESINILQSQQQKSSGGSEGSFVLTSSKISSDPVGENKDSQSISSNTFQSSNVSALSMKLASITSSSELNSSDNFVRETSPTNETFPNESTEDISNVIGRSSGSDPVPIAAPAKPATLTTGYMIRSPPLEVVKEEPAFSVSSSEQHSPLDTHSVLSNGQMDEDNVVFLNQKFDDIPMIDEVHASVEVTSKKQAVENSRNKVTVSKVIHCSDNETHIIQGQISSTDSSAVNTVLVNQDFSLLKGNVPSLKEGTSLDPTFKDEDVLYHLKGEHASYVPSDLLVKSSMNLRNKNHKLTKSNHAGRFTSSVGISNKSVTENMQCNISSTNICIGSASQSLHSVGSSKTSASVCKGHSKKQISPSPSPASTRQRKVATTSAPDITSLQASSVALTISSNVPNVEKRSSKDKM